MGSNEIAFKGRDADRSHPPDRFVSRWVWPRVIKEAADLRRIQRPAIFNGERIREAIPPPSPRILWTNSCERCSKLGRTIIFTWPVEAR